MEIFLLVILLFLLITIFRSLSTYGSKLTRIENEIQELKTLINRDKSRPVSESFQSKPEIPKSAWEKPKAPAGLDIKSEDLPAENTVHTPELSDFLTEPDRPLRKDPVRGQINMPNPPVKPLSQVQVTPKQSLYNKWMQDNPDIEKFIGENLINKIGIAVLVLGIAFFVKYAIDQDWINKTGRVCIGLFCGVILVWLASRLRKNYHAFSSVLIGGGISIFYFTIAFAFQQYHLIGQTAAFAFMVIITVFAVVLSILYNRIELGILAAAGGFITPFLVHQGDGNWIMLFTYLIILNAGLIVLAFYKRWRPINFIAFFFTQVIYLGFVFLKAGSLSFDYRGVFLFGVIFYLMFLIMNVIHHAVRGSKMKAFDFIILLSVNLCFYAAGMFLIQESGGSHWKGLFTASIGFLNLVMAYSFFKKSKADKTFLFLLIGLTITFISLAAPVQLQGHYITLFWSAEIVVLLWLYQKSFIYLLKITVLFVTAFMLISLFMDWFSVYADGNITHAITINKGFITGLFSSVSLFFVYQLLRKEADSYFIPGISNNLLRNIYLVGSILVFYAAGAFEMNDQFSKRFPASGLQLSWLQLYNTLIVLALLWIFKRFRVKAYPLLPVLLPGIVLVTYLFDFYSIHRTFQIVLASGHDQCFLTGGLVGGLAMLWMIRNVIFYIRNHPQLFGRTVSHLTWIIAVICITIVSSDIRNVYAWMRFADEASFIRSDEIFDKAGLTIIWAISSFVMIWLGMKYSYKPLRITALVLFGITLLKLFVYDIRGISPGGKIVAFILLGVLLLIISFMYQRLKKIIIDDQS